MKKLISVLISLVLIFSMVVPVGAADDGAADYDGYPLIVVRGIDFTGLHYEDGTSAIKVSFADIFSYLSGLFSDIFIYGNKDAFENNTLELVGKIFHGISADNEGNSINEVYVDKYEGSMANYSELLSSFPDDGETGLIKSAVDEIGAENVYYFTYDWRKSAEELSDELACFVDAALEETGKNKANFAAVSMGGMVITAYLNYHSSEKVNNLVYVSSAHNGTYACGDCLSGDIYFDPDVIYENIESASDGMIYGFMTKLLKFTGVIDLTASLINGFIQNNPQLLYNEVFRNSFGTALGFWALCPDEAYDEAVETVFGGCKEEYPVLMEKIYETRDFIFSTEEIIASAIDEGVNISFISNYGTALSPVTRHANQQGDGVIETSLSSNFAVTSPINGILSEEELATADPLYLSPDKTVDASTAIYRDSTWFVKDAPHVATIYGSEFNDFVLWLLLCEDKVDIRSNEKYPQFMKLDSENRLVKDE